MYTPQQIVEKLAVPEVYKLIQELKNCFRPSPVLDALSTFNLSNLPDSVGNLADYGNVSGIILLDNTYYEFKEQF